MTVIPASKRGFEAIEVIADAIHPSGAPPLDVMEAAIRVLHAYVGFVESDSEYSALLAEDDPSTHISGYGE